MFKIARAAPLNSTMRLIPIAGLLLLLTASEIRSEEFIPERPARAFPYAAYSTYLRMLSPNGRRSHPSLIGDFVDPWSRPKLSRLAAEREVAEVIDSLNELEDGTPEVERSRFDRGRRTVPVLKRYACRFKYFSPTSETSTPADRHLKMAMKSAKKKTPFIPDYRRGPCYKCGFRLVYWHGDHSNNLNCRACDHQRLLCSTRTVDSPSSPFRCPVKSIHNERGFSKQMRDSMDDPTSFNLISLLNDVKSYDRFDEPPLQTDDVLTPQEFDGKIDGNWAGSEEEKDRLKHDYSKLYEKSRSRHGTNRRLSVIRSGYLLRGW